MYTKSRIFCVVIVALAIIALFGRAGISAQQLASCQDVHGLNLKRLSRKQVSQIERAQHNIDSLNRKLIDAQHRLDALQRAIMPAAVTSGNSAETAAAITFISGPNEYCFDDIVVGYEMGDVVVYGHADPGGNLIVTGTGKVTQVDADGVGVHTTARVNENEPNLGDKMFVVNRANSPCSLSKFFK
jgi:hypothetical protein